MDDLTNNPRVFSFLSKASATDQIKFGSNIECEEFICSDIIRNYNQQIFQKM